MNEFLHLMGGEDSSWVNPGPLAIALRVAFAGLLGVVVSLLYCFSRGPAGRKPGLPSTLILLVMLITMVTLAVGQNVAVAFTLVGTLGIIRFRTPIRDIRDTSFVIFAVAAGIAVGRLNVGVALVSTAVIGGAIVLLRFLAGPPPGNGPKDQVKLRLDISSSSSDGPLFSAVLERFGVTPVILGIQGNRENPSQSVTLEPRGLARERAPELVAALLETPGITGADLRFEK